MSSRERMLARIRSAVEGSPDEALPALTKPESSVGREALVEQFTEVLLDYRATVGRIAVGAVATAVAAAVRRAGAEPLIVPAGFPTRWFPPELQQLSTPLLPAEPESAALETPATVLAGAGGVVTTCALAVAQTGTIILDGGSGQGTRAQTLVPDYHLCLVEANQIVETVAEAVTLLADAVAAGRPLTMISGPSATSDIELSRVEGVHGPRTLEVLIVA